MWLCAREFYPIGLGLTTSILLRGRLHCPRDPDRKPSCVNFFSALLKLVTDWSLVLSERSLRTEDGIFELFFFFLLLHLYSVDICNGCKINVSDVPVNVNKIKPILKSTRSVLEWCRHKD